MRQQIFLTKFYHNLAGPKPIYGLALTSCLYHQAYFFGYRGNMYFKTSIIGIRHNEYINFDI